MTTTIPLTRATRDTVTTLRNAVQEAAVSSERLSTGKAVNSALDDPNNYFTSKSLSDNAAQLGRIVEQLGQGIQVIKAADNGIASIVKLVDSANSVARKASDSDNAFERAQFAKDYNEVLKQVVGVANDSSYRGKNLLLGNGHDLKLYFGDSMNEAVTVSAIDFTNTEQSLGLSKLNEGQFGQAEIQLTDGTNPLKPESKLTDSSSFSVGDTITVTNGSGKTVSTLNVTDKTTVSDLVRTFDQQGQGIRANLDGSGTLKIETATDMTIAGGTAGGAFENLVLDATESTWFKPSGADASIEDLKGARDTVRLQETTIGTNLTMLQNRSDFMKSFSGSLLTSSEKLVAADPNEEGAKLLALNTRQQLAATSLSFSSEADQGILRLLGG
ncbi:flagellin [Oryzibacter oryziterrae]|uniref:flagellin n=1 Tax=Oryzibacter oryziterrae TaxID=2766474 RepID=UPI001F1765CD|nr:flagellin [Oryzibacter oryziterrae]